MTQPTPSTLWTPADVRLIWTPTFRAEATPPAGDPASTPPPAGEATPTPAGTTTTVTPSPTRAQTQPATPPPVNQPSPPSDAPATPPEQVKQYSQVDMDKAIEQRLARERKQAEDKAASERQAAEEQALKQRQEWQKLAEQHEARVRTLEPQLQTTQERLGALADRINKQIDAGIKEWPLEARKMIPASDDVTGRQDAYDNLRALMEKQAAAVAAATPPPRQPGTPQRQPRPAGPEAGPSVEEQLRASGRYSAI